MKTVAQTSSPDLEIVDFLIGCGVRNRTDQELARLEELRVFLEESNRRTNLTRVVSPHDFWIRHIADSLAIGRIFPDMFLAPRRVADVGCGAGFPLLPLAWAGGNLDLVGIDGKIRKIQFVNDCCARFGWRHAAAVAMQAREAARHLELAGSFDLVVSRAMSDCRHLLRECRGLLKPGNSRLVVYKTPGTLAAEADAALGEAAKFAFRFMASPVISLPGGGGERQFGIFERLA